MLQSCYKLMQSTAMDFWIPKLYIIVLCFHFSTMETTGQVVSGVNITANMDPPLSALANTPSPDPLRYNIMEGGVFTINCSVTFTEPYSFAIVELYKDSDVVQNAISFDSDMDVESVLNFSDFQSSDSGLYYCNVTVFSDNSSHTDTSNYRTYHTGAPSISLLTDPYLMLPINNPLVLEAEFDGVYYNHTWVYHPSDPNGSNPSSVIGADGVEGDLSNERLVINPTSPSFLPGYYIPRIYINDEGEILQNGVVLVYSAGSLSAMLSGDTPVRSGDDLVLTCTGTGYPQVSVNFEYGTILSDVTVSEEVVVSTATPTTPFTVERNITVRSVTVRECMERITCVANASDVTDSASLDIEITVTAELSKSGNVSVSIGDTLNLTCRAYDCEIDSFVFEWYLNGVELPMNVTVAQELALSHITVGIMSESDLGNYTCNLVNHDSSASVMVYELERAHASAMLSGDTSVRSGDDLVLTCTGTGYPQVSVNFEYGTILSDVTVSEEVVVSTATPITPFTVVRNITVRSVTVRECMERIMCVANATDVTDSASREIDVAVTAELSKSGNVSVSIGDTLNLTCRAYDCEIDSFVFEWYLNGEELPMSVVIVPELALSHITVEIMSESDLGNYTCNLVNHDSSASVMVYTLVSVTANMDPPLSALANTPSSDPLRYNIIEGGVFTINCSVTFTEPYSSASVEFYKDGSRLANPSLLPNVTVATEIDDLTIVITLSFLNFDPVHNGLYVCNVSSDVPAISNTRNHRFYHTGAPSISLLTDPYLMLPINNPLVLEAEFDGVYYNHTWVYHPSNPVGSNATSIIGADGVEGHLSNWRLVISPTSPSFLAGYYFPRIYTDDQGSFLQEAVLVYDGSDVVATLSGDSTVRTGDDISLTCVGTGYPQVSVSFAYSGLIAPVVLGNEVVTAMATPTTPYTVVRNITVKGLTIRDCGKRITCAVDASIRGVAKQVTSIKKIDLADNSVIAELSKSGNVSVSIGDTLNLTCRAYHCEIDSFVFEWYRNGVELPMNVTVAQELDLIHITVEITSESDLGNYTCTLANHDRSVSVMVYELDTYNISANMDPPQNTLAATPSSRALWHNLVEGSTFDINCYVSYIKPNSDFTVEFYKDGVLLSNESLPQVEITSRADNYSFVLMLSFFNFTTAHNGLYVCNVSSADRDLYATENYRIYQTGAPSISLLTDPYLMFPSDGPLVLEAEFDGVYYNHAWVYHPSDPLSSNATSIIGADGVEGDLSNERLVIRPTSPLFQAGYYIPRIYINDEGAILQNGVVLARSSENTTVILAGDSSVTSGDDVVLTCTGTGYPQVTVDWKTSGLSEFSSVSVGDETIVSYATPTTPFIVTRTISLRSVNVRDCGEVTCIARTIVSMVENTTSIEVDGPPIVTISPKEVVKDVGDEVVIHCRAYTCYFDTYQFDWYHNGAMLTEPKVHNEDYSSYLDLESLREEEFGYYTCVLVHHNTSSISYVSQRNSIVLHDELSQPPTSVLRATLTTPNLFNIKEGSSFSLTCTFEGVNDFSLVAYKNGEELFSTSDLRLYSVQMSLSSPARRSKTLVVNFTKFSDSSNAGSYVCRAENPTQVLDSRNISLLSANFCPSEIDEVWNIPWSDTLYGGTDVQNCSSDEGSGLATRKCSNGIWEDPDVNDCESAIFGDVRIKNGLLRENLGDVNLYNGTGLPIREEDLEVIAVITDTLVSNVDPETRTSPLFPKDLNTTNIFLDTVSLFADKTDLFAQPVYTEMELLLVADYILDSLYEKEWITLNEDEYSGGSPLLLTSIEMISLVLARELGSNNQTTTDSDNGMTYVTYQGERINIRSFQVSPVGNSGKEMYTTVIYPTGETDGAPQVCLPGEILAERAGEGRNGPVQVVAGVVMNFTNILPRRFNNKSPIGEREPSPYVVIAQVSGEENKNSAKFDNSTVKMTFETQAPYCNADCVSWDPGMDSNSTLLQSSGGWSTEGLSEGDMDSDREVLCSSTHLTSFTILVDYTPGVDQNLEFTIVSYVGCGISLVCLLLSLIFFLCQKKQVIENSVFFVHTNLCLALICGLILFFFIEEGGRQRIEAACSIVTFLIQYAFLSAFFWMLCEGIMMYILLVRVFGAHDKKWRLLFLIIGWGTPLIPAIVTIAVAYGTDKNYFIKATRCQWLCWLSQKEYFIWAFIAPMILLILINLVLGVRVMAALISFKRKHIKRTSVQKKNQELLRYSFKSFIFLLPLLGLTWLFGLLAANKLGGETQVFAWLFVICNTLQGCAFFFFHVVRHDKVWNKLEKTYCCKRWKEFSTKKSIDDTNETDRTTHSVPETPLKTDVIFNTTTETDIVLDASIVHTNGKAEVIDKSTDSNEEESATL